MSAEPAPMSCQELVELVTDYLEDVLDADTRARFEHHLAVCPGCEVYVRQIEETAARLGGLTADSLPPAAQEALIEAFRGFAR